MKIITCDSSSTCKKWPIWFTKNGHYHLFILGGKISSFCHWSLRSPFSRIHFRSFAISVKISSIFKTFFFAYASFFFKAKLLLLYFLLLLFTVHFEGFSLRLHFGLDFWRNQACRKSGQTCSDSLPPNADDQFDLRSVIFYYIFYQNEKTQNVKTKNSNNVFKMIVYHLVQSVQQCLCNDCVSFKAKTYVPCRSWKWIRNGPFSERC